MAQNHSPIESDRVDVQMARANLGILDVAWRRKSLVALGIMVGLIGGVLFYVSSPRIYQTKAQVLVVKPRPDNVTGIDTRNVVMDDYVATTKPILESPKVLDRAIKMRRLDALESFAGREDVLDALSKSITVSRNKSAGTNASNVLDLSFRGIKESEAPLILTAIIDSFKEYLDDVWGKSSADSIDKIEKERVALKKELADKITEYYGFLDKAPEFLGRAKDGGYLSQEKLGYINVQRSAMLAKKAELEGNLSNIDHTLKTGGNLAFLLAAMSDWIVRLETDTTRTLQPTSMKSQLLGLRQKLKETQENRGANSPEVVALQQQILETRSFIANPAAAFQSEQPGPDAQNRRHAQMTAAWLAMGPPSLSQLSMLPASIPPDDIDTYRTYFQQLLSHVIQSENILKGYYDKEQESAKVLYRHYRSDENYNMEIAGLQKMNDTINTRLHDVIRVKNMGGYEAQTIAPPSIAKKVSPSGMIILPVGLVLGIIAGFGLAFLAELKDMSFHSVDEIRTRLGLAVVGHIPTLKPAPVELRVPLAGGNVPDPMLCALYRPKSVEAESFRGVRTALYFSCGDKGHKVIQITSANGGDGKTTLACNLAISIAQSGKRILLIDADLRKPKVHKQFNLPNEFGLASVLSGQMEAADAIQNSGAAGLSILASGPIPPNPAELLTAPSFKEFLDTMREKFDIVLVDTPPLLVVTDPSVVATRVDGVLLTIRLTKDSRLQAVRARDILTTLEANVIGVIVNETNRQSAYGYGAGYGYGTGYGYGYTEGYHEGVKDMDGKPAKSDKEV